MSGQKRKRTQKKKEDRPVSERKKHEAQDEAPEHLPAGSARQQEQAGDTPVSENEPVIPEPENRDEHADAAPRPGPPPPAGSPTADGGRAWRPGDPGAMPPPGEIEQPHAPPLDRTREGAGAWGAPPPGQQPPADRTAGAPSYDKPGQLPRVVNQSDRAGPGERRYKIRADVPGEVAPTLYVLAEEGDVQGAVRAYAHAARLTGVKSKLDAEGKVSAAAREFEFFAHELPD